jgi:hypothetical protein
MLSAKSVLLCLASIAALLASAFAQVTDHYFISTILYIYQTFVLLLCLLGSMSIRAFIRVSILQLLLNIALPS